MILTETDIKDLLQIAAMCLFLVAVANIAAIFVVWLDRKDE